jgi:hypothetical protein
MEVDRARLLKFERGRREHGPVFLKDPNEEVFEEAIDVLNYCDELERREGQSRDSVTMRMLASELAIISQRHWKRSKGGTPIARSATNAN